MVEFRFFNAKHGDAFVVLWDTQPARTMLVDGGPKGLYEASLRDALLRTLPLDSQGRPRIDVACLTHVDDDHAAGLVRLFAEIRRDRRDMKPEPFAVARLWFNAVEELIEQKDPGLSASVADLFEQARTSEVMTASYNQGRQLRDSAAALNLSGNLPFAGPLVRGDTADVSGLRLTVVCPDETALTKLAATWREAKKRKDPEVITAAYADQSVPNLSSIVLFVEHGRTTALLTGDARGDHILTGLRAQGLLTDCAPLKVDLLKLPHHGSDRNLSRNFFDSVIADHYVISADGIAHKHPSDGVLVDLVASRRLDDHYTVHLTNDIPAAVARLQTLRTGRAFTVDVRERAMLETCG